MVGVLLLAFVYSPVFAAAYLAAHGLHWGWAGLLGALVSLFFSWCAAVGAGDE